MTTILFGQIVFSIYEKMLSSINRSRFILNKSLSLTSSQINVRFNQCDANKSSDSTKDQGPSSANAKESNQLDPNKKENLPQKTYRWGDPIPEKLFKRMRSEYVGLQKTDIGDDTEWIPIYQVPKIRLIRGFVKIKICVTFFSSYVGLSRLFDFINEPTFSALMPAAMCGTTVVTLIMLGDYCRRLIAQVYVTDDNRYIRITRLTFFGRRLDMVLPVYSILPLTENNVSKRKFMLKLLTIPPKGTIEGFDRPEFYDLKFNICLKYGGVLDGTRFERALGSILRQKESINLSMQLPKQRCS